jgi:hypothetical protein
MNENSFLGGEKMIADELQCMFLEGKLNGFK